MSKQRHDVFTITYDPRKGIPSGLLGAIISRLPEDAMIDDIQIRPAGYFNESAELAVGYMSNPAELVEVGAVARARISNNHATNIRDVLAALTDESERP